MDAHLTCIELVEILLTLVGKKKFQKTNQFYTVIFNKQVASHNLCDLQGISLLLPFYGLLVHT